jgi:predicted transcriptional regulator
MRVLLSIRPTHVTSILSGLKIFEFRRRIFARRDIHAVLIYCTKPVGRLVGEFEISDILEGQPEDLWVSTCHGSGISKSYFDAYFNGRLRAYALKIGEVRPFGEPILPSDVFANFTPPQSYMYVENDRAWVAPKSQLKLF